MSRRPDDGDGGRAGARWRPTRLLGSFGRFWWEFLVGDTPELLVGAAVAVAAVAALAHHGAARAVTVAAMPALVVVLLAVSSRRASRAGRAPVPRAQAEGGTEAGGRP